MGKIEKTPGGFKNLFVYNSQWGQMFLQASVAIRWKEVSRTLQMVAWPVVL
jgi:hypothetical protein